DRVTLEDAQALLGVSGSGAASGLARALADRDVAACLRAIDQLNAEGADLRQASAELIQYLRGVLLIRTGSGAQMLDVPADVRDEMEELAPSFEPSDLVRALKLLNEVEAASRFTASPQLPLELALLEAIAGEVALPARAGPSAAFPPPSAVAP